MWYGILRSQKDNKIISFIVDEDDMPVEYETEEQAYDSLKDHACFVLIDIIEIN